jgi:dUTP pyrophosphatase
LSAHSETVLITLLDERAQMPSQAHTSDAGHDVRCIEDFELCSGERRTVRTGLAMALPADWCCLVLARSGLAYKHGIMVVNGPGLIDSGYRGEVQVILLNTGSEAVSFAAGDRIAQLLFQPVPPVRLCMASELNATDRDGGFGSTGVA